MLIEKSDVSFNPVSITTNNDEFDININIVNIGKAIKDSFIVTIERKYPDGTIENNSFVVNKCVGKELLTVTLPVNSIKAGGINEFDIYIDAM